MIGPGGALALILITMINFFRRILNPPAGEAGNLADDNKPLKPALPAGRYMRYAIGEIVLVVVGILIALQINNWNENRKDNNIENKILVEISNGLREDLIDIRSNMSQHRAGLKACKYYHDLFTSKPVQADSINYYFKYLTMGYISIQNKSGYESLKSRGLELIKDDSLRIDIIKLYEQDYPFISKLEEQDPEGNFHDSYFKEINNHISPNLIFDENGDIKSIQLPLNITEAEQKKILSYLWKIKDDRTLILNIYSKVLKDAVNLQSKIEKKMLFDLKI